jgi:hypothetical protein
VPFRRAVAATALNPLTIALWTVSFPAAAPDEATRSAAAATAVLVGVGLGTLRGTEASPRRSR